MTLIPPTLPSSAFHARPSHYHTLVVLIGIITVVVSMAAAPSHATADQVQSRPHVMLVENGEPRAVIVLAAEPDRAQEQAGDEIIKHIELMSGAQLPVIAQGDDPAGRLPIRIGQAADDALDDMIRQHVGVSDGFALLVSKDQVQLRGLMSVGSQHAAFALLEQLGVRWHDPLEDKRVTPVRSTITLDVQRTFATPTDELRMLPPVTPRSTLYTMRMKRDHLALVARSAYVQPTPTADENFVLGQSHGWAGEPEPFHTANHVPPVTNLEGETVVPPVIDPQDVHAYLITDPEADGPKFNIVLTDGNHCEYTGSWSFHGTIEFLLSGDPRAVALRQHAKIYVYPMVNPDGRLILSRVRNPEVAAAGWTNHNRAWDTAGLFSTIDLLTQAIRYDTGGQALFLLDYHSNGTTIYSPRDLVDSPLIHAMKRHALDVGPTAFSTAGTTQSWALHDHGLSATYAFTLEHSPWEPLARCLAIGKAYGVSLHDVVLAAVNEPDAAPVVEVPAPRRRWVGRGRPADLMEAAAHGDVEAMRAFLAADADADVNASNLTGNTLLHHVAEDGHLEIAQVLIERGANVMANNQRNWTPLHYAARTGCVDVAGLLVEHGADVNATHLDGDTPLHVAASHGHAAVVKRLLEHGAEVDAAGRWGRSPLQWARRLGYDDVVELLEAHAQ